MLKAPKLGEGSAPELDYKDTDKTRTMRRAVLRLNKRLASTPLTITDPTALGFTEDGHLIDPTRRTLRRIFNNGKWDQGGRLYDAFWETMPRADRFHLLRLQGERVANVDYGQLFPRLAYVRAGMPVPEGDLYAVPGIDPACRAGVKRFVSSMLFGAGPLRNWPRGSRQHFPAGMQFASVVAAIRDKHQAIAHLFGTGIGHKLTFMESNVLMEVLAALAAEGIPALPIHELGAGAAFPRQDHQNDNGGGP